MPPAASDDAFAGLADDPIHALARHGVVRSYRKGAVIISEGDRADSMYVLLSGRVKIFLSGAQGHEMVIDTRGPGELVGEMMLDGGPRSASVMCLEPCRLAVIGAASLRAAIAGDPDFALRMIAMLIARARLATDLVRKLALMDVYGRVVGLLLERAVEREGRWVIAERLTQQEIADRVGASRDMVTRIFRELTAGGYVAVQNREITILRKPPPRW